MTNQKARDILLKQFDKTSGNYSYQNAEKIDLEEALYKGAEALVKQIPKAPIAEIRKVDTVIGNGTWKAGTTVHKCPACGTWISRLWTHCAFCGQALDWSEEE